MARDVEAKHPRVRKHYILLALSMIELQLERRGDQFLLKKLSQFKKINWQDFTVNFKTHPNYPGTHKWYLGETVVLT